MEGFEERWERIREKDRIFNQRMERMRKEQQESDERWELLREEQQRLKREQKNSLEGLLKSISYLSQVILERQGISNASYVASQLFDIRHENKEEETLPTILQLFDEKSEKELEMTDFDTQNKPEFMEQPFELRQTKSTCRDQIECLELPMEKVKPSIIPFVNPPCVATELKQDFGSVGKSYHPTDIITAPGQTKLHKIHLKDVMENLKPNPTFRSPITTPFCTQNNPNDLKPNPTLVTTQKPYAYLSNDLFGAKLDSMGGLNNKELAANIEEGADYKMNYLHDAFTIFLLSITRTVLVAEPFQVH